MNLTPFLEDDYLRLWNYSTQYCGKLTSINNIKYCFVDRGYFKGDSTNRYYSYGILESLDDDTAIINSLEKIIQYFEQS